MSGTSVRSRRLHIRIRAARVKARLDFGLSQRKAWEEYAEAFKTECTHASYAFDIRKARHKAKLPQYDLSHNGYGSKNQAGRTLSVYKVRTLLAAELSCTASRRTILQDGELGSPYVSRLSENYDSRILDYKAEKKVV